MMIQQLCLPPSIKDDYVRIPEEFKNKSNRWNYLCTYIMDSKQCADVRLVPRDNINPESFWKNAVSVMQRRDIPEYHKAALAAWILWTGFSDHYYEYD